MDKAYKLSLNTRRNANLADTHCSICFVNTSYDPWDAIKIAFPNEFDTFRHMIYATLNEEVNE
jgi:hypothetical protein